MRRPALPLPSVAERLPIRRLPQPSRTDISSTWRQAAAPRIDAMLRHAQSLPAGGWHVAAPSSQVPASRTILRTVMGQEVALWRGEDGTVMAGAGACPHLGAALHNCPTDGGEVLCRWHGLRLPSEWPGAWPVYPAFDDSVLVWVQLSTPNEAPHPEPVSAARPPLASSIVSVLVKDAACEPDDIIANRLDPWHGAWFHPYAFSDLRVDDAASSVDCLVVDVTFRLNRTYGVPVRATFTCPDRRTITMRIVEGEGRGSTVESHATLVHPAERGSGPVTQVTEATFAHSSRPGFACARALGGLIRPLMVRTQAQLWVDDLEYAERRFALRSGQVPGWQDDATAGGRDDAAH